MRRIAVKCSLLFFFIPLFAFAGKDGERVEKKINREFNIQPDGYVVLQNKYGDLDIAIGESNQVKINVTISVEASSTKKAQETLDRINVDFEEGNNRVQAKTEIESNSGWNSWFNFGKTEMKINYQVLVPADVYLDLCNKYGDIYVESSNRDVKIELAYGNIRLGDLNSNLKLDMSYSEGNISQIKDGDITLAYSDLEMEDGHDVTLNNKYTDIKTGSLHKLNMESAYSNLHAISIDQFEYNGKYDDVVLERAGSIDAETGYTGIVVEEFEGNGDFDMRYGDLKIQKIHHGFSKININTSYTGVEMEFNPDAAYTIDAETNYCDINHPGLKITEDSQRESRATLKGTRGSGGGEVIARMNYGELNID
ncbi:MAG: DUF4097 family beta strand repeat protein [Saprospiraceae bacterium]|uniref:DUF4097 family beta strand repeat protein n=1 Tax=Candidatus Opimibacter skivensis TaxID=2982028 RepID=A0A9D7SVS3_9BACT|nr:DUF4097 family beta strand repeat protein [Candidatus Opimibacter skivensis]